MQCLHSFFAAFDWQQVIASFLLLFASIDTPGNMPIAINIKKRAGGAIHPTKITVTAGAIMLVFFIKGQHLLALFCIDEASFSIAGGVVLFLLGLEMILGVSFFKTEQENGGSAVVPLAFPIIAGAGTMATLLTMKLKYASINILLAMLGNLVIAYLMLRYIDWSEHKLGSVIVGLSQKVMGLILLAIAIKIVRTNFFVAI